MLDHANFPNGQVLLVDAAGPHCLLALFNNGKLLASKSTSGDILENIFETTTTLLHESNTHLKSIQSFLYCSGPGSTLGLRLAAIAIRSWQTMASSESRSVSCYEYSSLKTAAVSICAKAPNLYKNFICAWKKGTFFCVNAQHPEQNDITSITEDLIHPQETCLVEIGRVLKRLPDGFTITQLDQTAYLHAIEFTPQLLKIVDAPKPFSYENPQFLKWEAKPHSA